MQKMLLPLGLVTFLFIGCATNNKPISNNLDTNYAKSYGDLTEVNNRLSPGVKIFSYNNPAWVKGKYTNTIINPVVFYSGESSQTQIEMYFDTNSRIELQQYLTALLKDYLTVVSKPATNATSLKITVTGAKLVDASDGYTPVKLIPVSQLLSGEPEQNSVLEISAEIRDSISGELLGSSVITINEEKLQQDVRSQEDFVNQVKLWSAIATKYAANYKVVND
ncbi:MAG: DUF3313 family protein [Neisseriales bacterium]|nr:MAG: DUF3313 family protein [Neisseriales bacterium]